MTIKYWDDQEDIHTYVFLKADETSSCERTSERTRMNEAYGTAFNGPFHNDDSNNGQNIELTLEFVTFITCRLGSTDDEGKKI